MSEIADALALYIYLASSKCNTFCYIASIDQHVGFSIRIYFMDFTFDLRIIVVGIRKG